MQAPGQGGGVAYMYHLGVFQVPGYLVIYSRYLGSEDKLCRAK